MKQSSIRRVLSYSALILGVSLAAGLFVACPNELSLAVTQVSTPFFSPSTGTYGADQLVTITCVTPGSTIYYTTDGSTPSAASTAYTAPIAATGDGTTLTIQAIALATGMSESTVGAATFTIDYSRVSTPQFSPSTGTYSADQLVTLTCGTPGASIYYTTDGSTPSAASTAYSAPIAITGSGTTVTIKAVALVTGMSDSTVGSASFTIGYPQVASPTFSPPAGVYDDGQLVTITCGTPGATIYYTTDGSTPTTSSTTYNAPVHIEDNGISATVKAMAVKAGMNDSVAVIAHYATNGPGTLDACFLSTGVGADDVVRVVAVQSDGKILIGGDFTTYNGTSRGRIARLNTDGSLDTGFATGSGTNGTVSSVAAQSDGKVLIGGSFTTYNGTSRGRIARLNTDGTLDTGFATGSGAGSNVYSISVQSDGKILIGGSFTTYDGTSRGRIARLNTGGTLNTDFATGSGADGAVWAVAVQNDGKVLIGGEFTSYDGTSRGRIARLNTNGTLNTGFAAGSGTNFPVYSVAVHNSGKVLIGGSLTTYDGTSRERIARLNTDGTLDTGFATGAGPSSYVYSVAVHSDGKILLGGQFTSYRGFDRGCIARIWD